MRRSTTQSPEEVLTKLVPQYVANKMELDSYTKICNQENSQIKSLMQEADLKDFTVGDYSVTMRVSKREKMDEDRLLAVLKRHGLSAFIELKEQVDMDALESYLYNNEISSEFATDLSSCKDTKEVVSLFVGKKKEEADE